MRKPAVPRPTLESPHALSGEVGRGGRYARLDESQSLLYIYLVLVQEVLVFLVLSHALKTSILNVKVVQVVVGIKLPQGCACTVRNKVPEEEVDGILLSAIGEGVAVVPPNGGEQLTVLVHGPHLTRECNDSRKSTNNHAAAEDLPKPRHR